MDFAADSLADGRKIRALMIVDDLTRESPVIEFDTSLPGRLVHGVAAIPGYAEYGEQAAFERPLTPCDPS